MIINKQYNHFDNVPIDVIGLILSLIPHSPILACVCRKWHKSILNGTFSQRWKSKYRWYNFSKKKSNNVVGTNTDITGWAVFGEKSKGATVSTILYPNGWKRYSIKQFPVDDNGEIHKCAYLAVNNTWRLEFIFDKTNRTCCRQNFLIEYLPTKEKIIVRDSVVPKISSTVAKNEWMATPRGITLTCVGYCAPKIPFTEIPVYLYEGWKFAS